MSAKRKLLLAAIVGTGASLGLLSTSGVAQTQIGGIITLKLSDPGGASEPWRVQRQLLRSWPGMRSCEAQKMSFAGFHIGRVEGFGLVAPSGTSPIIEVESIECITLRE